MNKFFNKLYGIEKGFSEGIKTYKDIVELKDDSDLRIKKVEVKLTIEEKELLKKIAKLKHKTMSDFVRELIFNQYLEDFIKIN